LKTVGDFVDTEGFCAVIFLRPLPITSCVLTSVSFSWES